MRFRKWSSSSFECRCCRPYKCCWNAKFNCKVRRPWYIQDNSSFISCFFITLINFIIAESKSSKPHEEDESDLSLGDQNEHSENDSNQGASGALSGEEEFVENCLISSIKSTLKQYKYVCPFIIFSHNSVTENKNESQSWQLIEETNCQEAKRKKMSWCEVALRHLGSLSDFNYGTLWSFEKNFSSLQPP